MACYPGNTYCDVPRPNDVPRAGEAPRAGEVVRPAEAPRANGETTT
jgi:hypothetical protein